MAQSAPSTLQLGLLPPEVLWLIASHLDYTDLACLVLSSSDLHAQLTRTWTWSMADHSRSEHIGHFLAAVAIRMRPAQFVHDFLGHEFMRNAWAWGCETNELSHAALQCRSRHEWTPDLFAAMCASSYDDDFDLQRAHMGAEHCNSDLVHLSMLVMWVSSQFMGSSCSIADVLQVMIGPKGLMNHFCGSGEGDITFSKKDRERRALAAINADILDECLYMCSNGVQGEGSIDAKAPFGILEMNDGGLYCLCSWAVDLRRLADPFVSIGLLSHRELIDNFLSHSMSAPVQRAVFLTEYWYGAECVYDYESAWALGHAVAEIEREPPPPLTDSSKLSWWVLMWLRFICISDVENGGSSCASVASVLMAYLQGFTMGPGGSAADEDIWNKTLVEEVVLGLDGLQSGCSLPKWLKPMRHLVSRDASPYSFASALGRCLGAVNAPISAVLKIFNMYIDAACATEHDPYLKAAPGNMAAGVGADAAAFLRGWEEQAEFTLCMSSMHTRENVSRCLTSACTRSSTIKKVMAPLVYDWIRALGMDMPMPIGPTAMTGATIFQSLQKISQWEPSSMSRTGSAVF